MNDQLDDAAFDILTHSRRRRICEVIAAEDQESLPLDALAERVVERESGAESASPADSTRRVAIELYHLHLPKLDEAELVSFDAETRTVTYEGHPLVEAVAEEERPGESSARQNDETR